jgi:hypothetical protein
MLKTNMVKGKTQNTEFSGVECGAGPGLLSPKYQCIINGVGEDHLLCFYWPFRTQ